MPLSRRLDARYCLILLLAALLLWAPRLRGPIDLRFDAGVYYVLGTSLAQGNGYRLLNEPGEIQAVQYPPLLPAFVAVHQKVLGTSDPSIVAPWLRRSYCLMFITLAIAVYAMARQWLTPGYSFIVALMCIASSDGLYLSDMLFAELPFALVTVLFVLCNRLSAKREALQPLTAILAVAAYLLRSTGIALLAAWVGQAVLRRQWRQAALRAVLAMLPIITWQGYIHHVQATNYQPPAYAYQRAPYQFYNVTYGENLSLIDPFQPELGKMTPAGMAQRVVKNVVTMPAWLGQAVSMPREYWHWALHSASIRAGRADGQPLLPWNSVEFPLAFLGVITLAGAVMFLSKSDWLVPLYLGGSLAIICITPWPHEVPRYLVPLAPFAGLCVVRALAGLGTFARKTFDSSISKPIGFCAVAAMAMILVVEASASAALFASGHRFAPTEGIKLFYYNESWASYDAALNWLKIHGRAGDVIASSSPHRAHIKTGMRAIFPPMEPNRAKAGQLLESVPVRYVIVGNFNFISIDKRYVAPILEANPTQWRLVYTAPDGIARVYERTRLTTAAK